MVVQGKNRVQNKLKFQYDHGSLRNESLTIEDATLGPMIPGSEVKFTSDWRCSLPLQQRLSPPFSELSTQDSTVVYRFSTPLQKGRHFDIHVVESVGPKLMGVWTW